MIREDAPSAIVHATEGQGMLGQSGGLLGVLGLKYRPATALRQSAKETGYGAQKSLVLTLAGLRQSLKKPNTALRWTDTSSMFVDGGNKKMHTDHLRARMTPT